MFISPAPGDRQKGERHLDLDVTDPSDEVLVLIIEIFEDLP
jgi:hypothetical protein